MRIIARFTLLSTLILLLVLAAVGANAKTCEKPFSKIFEESRSSVVQIFSVRIDPFNPVERVKYSTGSGLIIDDEAHVVTNAHVVHLASEIVAVVGESRMLEAELVGSDPISDIAVLRLKNVPTELDYLPLGGERGLEVGQEVIAIGHPYGMGKSASQGILSDLEVIVPLTTLSWETPLILSDASINPGNSGGPLISRCGDVVGITSIRFEQGSGLGLSIPSAAANAFAEQIIREGRVIRPWHGINGKMLPLPLQHLFSLPSGLLVETVEPGSPAEKIGLHGGKMPLRMGAFDFILGGEIILSVNGVRLRTRADVAQIARDLEVGQELTIEVWQEGSVRKVTTQLPERPVLEGDLRLLYASSLRREDRERP